MFREKSDGEQHVKYAVHTYDTIEENSLTWTGKLSVFS